MYPFGLLLCLYLLILKMLSKNIYLRKEKSVHVSMRTDKKKREYWKPLCKWPLISNGLSHEIIFVKRRWTAASSPGAEEGNEDGEGGGGSAPGFREMLEVRSARNTYLSNCYVKSIWHSYLLAGLLTSLLYLSPSLSFHPPAQYTMCYILYHS